MILHVIWDEKFTNDYIELINSNFSRKEHKFFIIILSGRLRYCKTLKNEENVYFVNKDMRSMQLFITNLIHSNKIIAHGLYSVKLVFLYLILNLAKKTYWVIWGGDLYNFKNENFIQKYIKSCFVKNLKGIITIIRGDYDLAKLYYKAKCPLFQSIGLPSNIVDNNINHRQSLPKQKLTILIGNSADRENNHYYIFKKLSRLNLDDYKILIPLSYGDASYADEIERFVKENFKCEVECLHSFLEYEKYMEILKTVDIAIFAHDRQQGFGNIINLIAFGTKIFIKHTVTTYTYLKENGLIVFDTCSISQNSLKPLLYSEKVDNFKKITSISNMKKLISEWDLIFKDR